MSDLDFRRQTPHELGAMVLARQVSAVELVDHALGRIDARNGELNAFVAVDADGARQRAALVDQAVARGDDVGPLAGVPIGVKDLESAAGFVTSEGSAAHAGDPPATRDSVLVARLRAAGCVVVGKTNAPEFGLKPQTDNPTFGITGNPWDARRTPGGSSGGSSSAVAAGMVPLATGSDGGGSIRIPSAACALAGFKPSLGRIPTADPSPPGWMELSTRGVMVRTVATAGACLDLVRGPHPHDLRSLPADTGSWAKAAATPDAPRRAVWCPTLGYAEVDDEIVASTEAAVRVLESAGCEVVDLDTVFTEDPGGPLGALVSAYMHRTVEPFRGTPIWNQLDPLVVVSAEMARLTSSVLGLLAAEDARHRLNMQLAAVFEQGDVLLCPTTCGQLPLANNPATIDQVLGALGETAAFDIAGVDAEAIVGLMEFIRDREPINFPMGTINGKPVLDWTRLTQPFNLTRSPAGSVCSGFTADGLPIGLQIVGPQHGDELVLRTMAFFESALGVDTVAPG